jgi:DNA repair exonuclease SbcCD ATPase subunit
MADITPQDVRQELLDLIVGIEAWIDLTTHLQERIVSLEEANRRLEYERLGMQTRLENELTESRNEWSTQVLEQDSTIKDLRRRIDELTTDHAAALDAIAVALDERPTDLKDMVTRAVFVIEEAKKMIRENL